MVITRLPSKILVKFDSERRSSMFQIRIVVKLGGPVGELGLFNQDLADLCEIQPKLAGEWISGGIERLSLVDLGRIMTELELLELGDVFEVQIIGTQPPREGRRERIMEKLEPKRVERKLKDKERRKIKSEQLRQQIEEEIRRDARKRKKPAR
jgi:hypothetical protein